MEEEKVVLVDLDNQPIGTMGKMEAHEKALLHRAFSVFVMNSKNELLIQQRAFDKYHSPGLWTNTCCSHQREGESNIEAGNRRLIQEMGMNLPLEELFTFVYKASFDNGLTEHELDHVMLGFSEEDPKINSDEVEAFKWIHIDAVKEDLKKNPNDYTVWFAIIFNRFYQHIQKRVN
ncbi:MAG: isopentenyl-diphosphate Delta-isomerase [Flavobacteriaceae bacterium]